MSDSKTSPSLQQHVQAGLLLHRQGQFSEAEDQYRQALALVPGHAGTLFLLGTLLHQTGRISDAVIVLRQAAQAKPGDVNFRSALATVLFSDQQWEAALFEAEAAIKLDANHFDAAFVLACTLEKMEKPTEAMEAYRKAAALRPAPQCHQNLGLLLLKFNRAKEAEAEFQAAVALNPSSAENWCNLAEAQLALGQADEAVNSCERCVAVDSKLVRGHAMLCKALGAVRRFDDAIAAGMMTIGLQNNAPTGHLYLADAYLETGRTQSAISQLQDTLELIPDSAAVHSRLVMNRCYELPADPAGILKTARDWADRHTRSIPKMTPAENDRSPDRRLKIGYVSADFRNHPLGHFMIPIIERHHRAQFEIHCFSNVRQRHRSTEWFQNACDQWHDIVDLSDDEAAERIRRERIDILVDLSLHSDGNRLLIFAQKPAPIQMSYLAYCSTTGMDTMDYLLCDRSMIPPGDETFFTETPLRLPNTYWCWRANTAAPVVGPLPAKTNGFITFGSLNHPAKFSDAILSVWAKVLNAVPLSRLVLSAPPGTGRDRITDHFARAGVGPSRIEFHDRVSLGQYLELQTGLDIALDPFPFTGGTTSCDALWMGAPVITLTGKTALSRGGLSILSTIGLPQFAVETPGQYVEAAAGLAGDLDQLTELRQSMRSRMQASPLMDEKAFVKDLEALYRRAWKQWATA